MKDGRHCLQMRWTAFSDVVWKCPPFGKSLTFACFCGAAMAFCCVFGCALPGRAGNAHNEEHAANMKAIRLGVGTSMVPGVWDVALVSYPDGVFLDLHCRVLPFHADTWCLQDCGTNGLPQKLVLLFRDDFGKEHRFLLQPGRARDFRGEVYFVIYQHDGKYKVKMHVGQFGEWSAHPETTLKLKRSLQPAERRSDYSYCLATDASSPLRDVSCRFPKSPPSGWKTVWRDAKLETTSPLSWNMHERIDPVPASAEIAFTDCRGNRHILVAALDMNDAVLHPSFRGDIVFFLHEGSEVFELRIFVSSAGRLSSISKPGRLGADLERLFKAAKWKLDVRAPAPAWPSPEGRAKAVCLAVVVEESK